MKFKFLVCLLIFFVCAFCFAQDFGMQDFSAKNANRQTALRYLRLAKNYALQSDWRKAASAAKGGNDYDQTVADLWYLMALANYNNGEPRKNVIPLLEKALSGAEWVDYNKSSARIFYADVLCSTGNPAEALRVIDEKPFIYSADAEYVRIKSYYSMGGVENVQLAREKVDVSRRIYPADARFAHLFFAYEYKIMYSRNYEAGVFDYMPLEGSARKIADYFIARVPEYDSRDVELEMFAAIFSEGEKKTRLLKAFDARGFKSPLFAATAMEDGVLEEAAALEYFLDFMEKGIDLFEVERFACTLKDEDVKKNFAKYLNAYTGTLYGDTNNSLERNLEVVYNRGRPEKVLFDYDNDGVNDWICECDFGVPRNARFLDKKIAVYYGTYPSPVRIVFEEVPGEEGITIFNLANETVDAEIFRIIPDGFVAAAEVAEEFFIVDSFSLWSGETLFDRDRLIVSISSMERPSKERDGAMIRFSMLNGEHYAADYLIGEKVYAHAQFTSPLVRNVDRDGDGIFETTEIYSDITDDVVIPKEDLDAASQNIWGAPAPDTGRYLQMIQIDRNNDTVPDFTEEYLTLGGRISTWDLDYDGQWDSRHTILPQKQGEPRAETTEIFVVKPDSKRDLVAIHSLNDVPQKIVLGSKDIAVTKGLQNGFYWVGAQGTKDQELNVLGKMGGAMTGVVAQFEEEENYIQAVFIDGNIFARVLEKVKNENIE